MRFAARCMISTVRRSLPGAWWAAKTSWYRRHGRVPCLQALAPVDRGPVASGSVCSIELSAALNLQGRVCTLPVLENQLPRPQKVSFGAAGISSNVGRHWQIVQEADVAGCEYSKLVADGKKLEIATENSGVSIHPACVVGAFLTTDAHRLLGENYPPMLCSFRGHTNQWANDLETSDTLSRRTLSRLLARPAIVREVRSEFETAAAALTKTIDDMLVAGPEGCLSELLSMYHRYNADYAHAYLLGWLPLAAEGLAGNLSGRIVELLSQLIRERDVQRSVAECFSVLVGPNRPSIRQRERLDFFALVNTAVAALGREGEDQNSRGGVLVECPEFEVALSRHHEEYSWMAFDYEGPAIPISAFRDEVLQFMADARDPDEERRQLLAALEEAGTERAGLERLLSINEHDELNIAIGMAREFTDWKRESQELLFRSYFALDHLLTQLAQKAQIDRSLLRCLLPSEMDEFFLSSNPPEEELIARRTECLLVFEPGEITVLTPPESREKLATLVAPPITEAEDGLRGLGAYPGLITGPARLVESIEDLGKVNPGDVMVSSKTNPNLVVAMKRCAAIVTDYGGLTCHAAILSHELMVPTVVGTRVATRAIRDGDTVRVDADSGIVNVLEKGTSGVE
jgi:phosphohistidine swiveling domain-containing protein